MIHDLNIPSYMLIFVSIRINVDDGLIFVKKVSDCNPLMIAFMS